MDTTTITERQWSGRGAQRLPRGRRTNKEAPMGSTFVRWILRGGLGSVLLFAPWLGLMLASGMFPGTAIAKMNPPKTKVESSSRLPAGTNCSRSAGNWRCSAKDGSLWTCSSNSDGSINTGNCACLSGCPKPQPTPTPTP